MIFLFNSLETLLHTKWQVPLFLAVVSRLFSWRLGDQGDYGGFLLGYTPLWTQCLAFPVLFSLQLLILEILKL